MCTWVLIPSFILPFNATAWHFNINIEKGEGHNQMHDNKQIFTFSSEQSSDSVVWLLGSRLRAGLLRKSISTSDQNVPHSRCDGSRTVLLFRLEWSGCRDGSDQTRVNRGAWEQFHSWERCWHVRADGFGALETNVVWSEINKRAIWSFPLSCSQGMLFFLTCFYAWFTLHINLSRTVLWYVLLGRIYHWTIIKVEICFSKKKIRYFAETLTLKPQRKSLKRANKSRPKD